MRRKGSEIFSISKYFSANNSKNQYQMDKTTSQNPLCGWQVLLQAI